MEVVLVVHKCQCDTHTHTNQDPQGEENYPQWLILADSIQEANTNTL